MRKKSLIVSIFIIVSLMTFGCSNSASPSDTSSGYTKSDSKDNSSNDNQNDSKDSKSQENNLTDNNQSREATNTTTVNKKNEQYIICIDPGHQTKGDMSEEPVAPGSSEKKFKVSWGTQGVATKIPEYELTLSAIFANDNNADLVIRIHADGSDDSSTTGASLHIPSQDSQYTSKIYPESNECAKLISLQMKQDGFKVNDIYQRSDLTGFNWSKVPVVLVEMGFMSNPEEDQKMAETSYQEKMMKSVAEGAQAYFENK